MSLTRAGTGPGRRDAPGPGTSWVELLSELAPLVLVFPFVRQKKYRRLFLLISGGMLGAGEASLWKALRVSESLTISIEVRKPAMCWEPDCSALGRRSPRSTGSYRSLGWVL